jgi:hypothetical protein
MKSFTRNKIMPVLAVLAILVAALMLGSTYAYANEVEPDDVDVVEAAEVAPDSVAAVVPTNEVVGIVPADEPTGTANLLATGITIPNIYKYLRVPVGGTMPEANFLFRRELVSVVPYNTATAGQHRVWATPPAAGSLTTEQTAWDVTIGHAYFGTAHDAYTLRATPYYFWLSGNSGITPPTTWTGDVIEFGSGTQEYVNSVATDYDISDASVQIPLPLLTGTGMRPGIYTFLFREMPGSSALTADGNTMTYDTATWLVTVHVGWDTSAITYPQTIADAPLAILGLSYFQWDADCNGTGQNYVGCCDRASGTPGTCDEEEDCALHNLCEDCEEEKDDALSVHFNNYFFPSGYLEIEKIVTGNLGDRTRLFEFEIEFELAAPAPDNNGNPLALPPVPHGIVIEYTITRGQHILRPEGVPAAPTPWVITGTLVIAPGETELSDPFGFQLGHLCTIVFTGIPYGTDFRVEETAAPDYATYVYGREAGVDISNSLNNRTVGQGNYVEGTVNQRPGSLVPDWGTGSAPPPCDDSTCVAGDLCSYCEEYLLPENWVQFRNDNHTPSPMGVFINSALVICIVALAAIGSYMGIMKLRKKEDDYEFEYEM